MCDDIEQGAQTLREMFKQKVEQEVKKRLTQKVEDKINQEVEKRLTQKVKDEINQEVEKRLAKFEEKAAYTLSTHFAWQHYENTQILEDMYKKRIEEDSEKLALVKAKKFISNLGGNIPKNNKTLLTKIADLECKNKLLVLNKDELNATIKELEDNIAAETTKRQEAEEDLEFFEKKYIEALWQTINNEPNFMVDQEILAAALTVVTQRKAKKNAETAAGAETIAGAETAAGAETTAGAKTAAEAETTEEDEIFLVAQAKNASLTKRRRVLLNSDSD